MGINDTVLAEFGLDSGEHIRLEHTENREVHIHIDNMRLSLTESEFEELAMVTATALDELVEIKQL